MDIDIKAIYTSPGHDFIGRHGKGRLNNGIQQKEQVECVAGKGIIGDRFFDYKEDFKGQITFFDWDVYKRIKKQFNLPNLEPSVFRRNILTNKIDLNSLIGKRFTIQSVEFEGIQESAPCYWMDKAIGAGAEEALKGHGGLRAKILTNGSLKVSKIKH